MESDAFSHTLNPPNALEKYICTWILSVHALISIYIYIYIYREREREKKRKRERGRREKQRNNKGQNKSITRQNMRMSVCIHKCRCIYKHVHIEYILIYAKRAKKHSHRPVVYTDNKFQDIHR